MIFAYERGNIYPLMFYEINNTGDGTFMCSLRLHSNLNASETLTRHSVCNLSHLLTLIVSKGCPTKTWQNPANPPASVSIVDSVRRIVVIFCVFRACFRGWRPQID